MKGQPRSNPAAMILVGAAILVIGWLAVRQMTESQRKALQQAHPSATTGRDPNAIIVPPIPSYILADAGTAGVMRIDLVVRVDGVDVASEGAATCRRDNHTVVGRDRGGAVGSFDETALSNCLLGLLSKKGERLPVVTITRAGDAVPKTYLDALVASVKRVGVEHVVLAP